MSDHIPFEIQAEIMKRLPVRSLIQFRSVSKAWKSHIDSSDFIAHYSSQQKHLLVRYGDSIEQKYVSIVDDDTFPQHKVSLTIPPSVKMLKYSRIFGSSHGLLCLKGDYRNVRGCPISGTGKAVIWNLSTRKTIDVIMPNMANGIYGTALGFGVCRETNDPKIVKIIYIAISSAMESISSVGREVEVFTLRTGAWRSPYNTNIPRKSIQFGYSNVLIDGFLYWLAEDFMNMDRSYNLIISFDITSEEFREVSLPYTLAHAARWYRYLSISMLRESLVVLEDVAVANGTFFGVWMMEDGVPKSFTKLFNVNVNTPNAFVKGFRKSGEPTIDIVEDLGINEIEPSFFVYHYLETLLLFDQPDFGIYDKGKHYVAKWRAKRRLLRNASKV
ncbi:hypothetical protein L1987_65258 [Smallanthus sonchifolius]|uniref:Uncharacterized protein n=1 Tax=Smallanthus sonchifolius TaxID=185202 RepID=A0ACB9BU20_9ASTR|nr:hypothetical protein L1987_65258 [Smallanthus sonchifolius]